MLKRIFENCFKRREIIHLTVGVLAFALLFVLQGNGVSGAQLTPSSTISGNNGSAASAASGVLSRSSPNASVDVAGPWSELLVNQSITDFCGLQDWHVRQGYQILRRQYANDWPVSFERLQKLRIKAVEQAENALLGLGFQNYNWYCSTQGQEAAQFFVDVWAASVTDG